MKSGPQAVDGAPVFVRRHVRQLLGEMRRSSSKCSSQNRGDAADAVFPHPRLRLVHAESWPRRRHRGSRGRWRRCVRECSGAMFCSYMPCPASCHRAKVPPGSQLSRKRLVMRTSPRVKRDLERVRGVVQPAAVQVIAHPFRHLQAEGLLLRDREGAVHEVVTRRAGGAGAVDQGQQPVFQRGRRCPAAVPRSCPARTGRPSGRRDARRRRSRPRRVRCISIMRSSTGA